jgi:hypothetical protein
MNGRNKVSGVIIKNGNPMKFHFDGNPCTQTGWTERNDTLAPGDRRILGTIPPQFLAPEAELNVTMAFVYARASSGDHLSSVCELQTAVDEVKTWYNNQSTGLKEKITYNYTINIYPNPTSNSTLLDMTLNRAVDVEMSIVDALGRVLTNKSFGSVSSLQYQIDVNNFAAGVYLIRIRTDKEIYSKQLIVVKN